MTFLNDSLVHLYLVVEAADRAVDAGAIHSAEDLRETCHSATVLRNDVDVFPSLQEQHKGCARMCSSGAHLTPCLSPQLLPPSR